MMLKCYRPGRWCSSNEARLCSVFTIGRIMLHEMEVAAAGPLGLRISGKRSFEVVL
jgi:hypothetical protein